MTKVIEILFRNKGKLLALLLLPILVSGVVVFFLPRYLSGNRSPVGASTVCCYQRNRY